MEPRRVEVCGVSVDCVDAAGAVARAEALMARAAPAAIYAVNPEKAIQCGRDARLKRALDSAGLLIPDGIGVVLAARLLHGAGVARVPGCELMPALCAHAAAHGRSVFLFGGAPGVAEAAAASLHEANPALRIAGTQHGYLDAAGTERLIERINALKPDILFVALGSPRQEFWIAENLPNLDIRLCQAVGGTFDVLAGTVKRAPRMFRAVQLEWLYRLLSQPKRALRQTALPLYAGRVARAYVARRLPRRPSGGAGRAAEGGRSAD
jgi:N-acetylglucosaminyldiphosphoundecaprenol N-acetyl-beta-D-mannosaminyltransferase